MDFEQVIDWLNGSVGRKVTMVIGPAGDTWLPMAATTGTLRHGDLDKADGTPIHLPDEPERVWFRIETESGQRAMDFYLAPAWFRSARTHGSVGLEIEAGDITLMFSTFTTGTTVR